MSFAVESGNCNALWDEQFLHCQKEWQFFFKANFFIAFINLIDSCLIYMRSFWNVHEENQWEINFRDYSSVTIEVFGSRSV